MRRPTLDNSEFENFTFTEARHMPIVKQYAKRLNLVETVNQMVDSHMELSPGLAVMGMVIDTLSGRTPLYRLSAFFRDVDVPLLLGTNAEASLFEDHNLGRALDKIYETGTQKIFSQIALNAVNVFDVDVKRCHFDTTSVSVYGDYGFEDPPFQITYGHSKDHRPDLKQFLVTMLCVDRNIPILGATKNGNASDKALNNELLTDISKYMAKYKLQPGAYVYVADSAFVTEKNLKEAGSDIKFLSRLPATYNACHQAIQQAVGADEWQDIGTLAQNKGTQKRPPAQYRSFETTIDLYGNPYRAIVVHSSAHDKRRHKRIDRLIKQKRKPLEESCKKIASTPFFCREDAENAIAKLNKEAIGSYHQIRSEITEIPKYPRGRPPKNKPHVPQRYEYEVSYRIEEDPDQVAPLRLEAGCFVLITNLNDKDALKTWTAENLLVLYKDQTGIEQNFGFLKDPVIVNSIFLKKPQRIEVLGMVLLIALLIWRLMERSMRQYVEKTGNTITGWENRPTKKPTAFMMTTKFAKVLVVNMGNQRKLARSLTPVQLEYLRALNVDPSVYTDP